MLKDGIGNFAIGLNNITLGLFWVSNRHENYCSIVKTALCDVTMATNQLSLLLPDWQPSLMLAPPFATTLFVFQMYRIYL